MGSPARTTEAFMGKAIAGKGSKLERSETVSVRLDPKLRYLVEIAARKQRRSVSSLVEWACEAAMAHVLMDESKPPTTLQDVTEMLWDVDEADRFVKLAINYPALLTHSEQMLWKVIRETALVWRGGYDKGGEWAWVTTSPERDLILDRVQANWTKLLAVASGEADRSTLPKVKKTPNPIVTKLTIQATPPSETATDDDDIPF